MAPMVWPKASDATPTTATSSTCASARSTRSISSAEILYPPDLITSTLARPRMRYTPVTNEMRADRANAANAGRRGQMRRRRRTGVKQTNE
eukprot:4063435-Prymnesium_polylepis.1